MRGSHIIAQHIIFKITRFSPLLIIKGPFITVNHRWKISSLYAIDSKEGRKRGRVCAGNYVYCLMHPFVMIALLFLFFSTPFPVLFNLFHPYPPLPTSLTLFLCQHHPLSPSSFFISIYSHLFHSSSFTSIFHFHPLSPPSSFTFTFFHLHLLSLTFFHFHPPSLTITSIAIEFYIHVLSPWFSVSSVFLLHPLSPPSSFASIFFHLYLLSPPSDFASFFFYH